MAKSHGSVTHHPVSRRFGKRAGLLEPPAEQNSEQGKRSQDTDEGLAGIVHGAGKARGTYDARRSRKLPLLDLSEHTATG